MGIVRLLLALSVLIFHSAPLFGIGMMDGIVAVKGFFVISGFYMALILNEKYIGKKASYKLFISNRFLRIYPIYWFILVLTIVVGYIWAYNGASLQTLIPNNNHPHGIFLYTSLLGILRDITLLLRSDYLNPSKLKLPIVAPAWTLVVEFLFYLVAPFMLKRKWWFLLIVLILSFLIRYELYFNSIFSDEYHITAFFPASIGYFLIGVFSYKLYEKLKHKKISVFPKIGSLFIVAIFIFFWDKIPAISVYTLILKDSLFYPMLYITLPFIFIISNSIIFDKLLADLSYPIYICHWFVFSVIWNTFSFKSRTQLFVIVFIVTSITFGLILKKFIDDPINKYRQSRMN